MSSYKLFDRNRLKIKPLKDRRHDLNISVVSALGNYTGSGKLRQFREVARHIIRAKERGASVILMIGGHVLRSGVQRYVIDLMERKVISCIAMNGSGVIHDFELALIGATTESVARYIQEGQFGLWRETGRINDYVNKGFKFGLGLGEAVGKAIYEGDFPYKDISLLAKGWQLKIPVTAHIGIGYDIIHEHPNFDGAAAGAVSYRDFLIFSGLVEKLEGGVVMNFGSAVMAPEVFLKALSMARNVAIQKKKQIKHFTALVCDLYSVPGDFSKEPDKRTPAYYFRPWKTMLVRTVAGGGDGFYVRGRHSDTIPALWAAINQCEQIISQ